MRTKNRNLLLLLLLIGCLCICGLIGKSGVHMYLADKDHADNELSIGGNDVEIEEDYMPPASINPGTEFRKDVRVKNTGTVDCYIRVKVLFSDSDMGVWYTPDYDDTGIWVCNVQDGYWYYTQAVSPGESTVSLFETVKISHSIPEDKITDFDIIIYAESCQSGECEAYDEAWNRYINDNKPLV